MQRDLIFILLNYLTVSFSSVLAAKGFQYLTLEHRMHLIRIINKVLGSYPGKMPVNFMLVNL